VVEAQSHVVDGRRSWSQAEHRARPTFVQSQSGYMQGAAGIASFLIHLSAAKQSSSVISNARIVFPDEVL
jgi:hypothetical protein